MCLQVCLGLPLLFFSYGFHSRAVLATCPSGLLSVWPIQPHTRFFISSPTSHCPACLHNSSFQIVWSHQMYRILLRHLLKNTCNFSTIFTFDPRTLNLVLCQSCIANTFLSFPIHSLMSYSVTLLTHSTDKLPTLIQFLYFSYNHHSIPQFALCLCVFIFRSAFAHCSSQACVLSFISCILCDKEARSYNDLVWDH